MVDVAEVPGATAVVVLADSVKVPDPADETVTLAVPVLVHSSSRRCKVC